MDLDEYRADARAWLAANLQLKDAAPALTDAEERAVQATLAAGGYAGIPFPVEYGGRGLTLDHQAAFWAEAEPYQMPHGLRVSLAMIAPTLLDCAAPEFLAEHLPRMFSGAEKWIQLLSEPSGGSDLAGVLTRATQDEQGWVINGSKIWSTDAATADYGLCLARNDFDRTKHAGLTMFALPMRAPGVTVNPITKSDGDAGEFYAEFFDDVRLEPNAVVGEVNRGWSVAQRLLIHERDTTGGVGFGVGLHPKGNDAVSIDDLLRLVADRGTPVAAADEQLLAEAYLDAVVHYQLSDRIMSGYATGNLNGPWGSLLKLGAGLRTHRRAEIAVELLGPAAVAWPDGSDNGPLGSSWLNAMVLSVAGGSNEMQRNTITERLLGLPREPAADKDIPFGESLRRRTKAAN